MVTTVKGHWEQYSVWGQTWGETRVKITAVEKSEDSGHICNMISAASRVAYNRTCAQYNLNDRGVWFQLNPSPVICDNSICLQGKTSANKCRTCVSLWQIWHKSRTSLHEYSQGDIWAQKLDKGHPTSSSMDTQWDFKKNVSHQQSYGCRHHRRLVFWRCAPGRCESCCFLAAAGLWWVKMPGSLSWGAAQCLCSPQASSLLAVSHHY